MPRDPILKGWRIGDPSEKIIRIEEDERLISKGILGASGCRR
jgi:hypothetical protein